jgi:hypothetical protein
MAQTRKLAADYRQMTGQPLENHEASREVIEDIMAESNCSKRGAMPVAYFNNIARLVWCQDKGKVDD